MSTANQQRLTMLQEMQSRTRHTRKELVFLRDLAFIHKCRHDTVPEMTQTLISIYKPKAILERLTA